MLVQLVSSVLQLFKDVLGCNYCLFECGYWSPACHMKLTEYFGEYLIKKTL